MSAIKARDLRKSYGRVIALRGLSFEVPEGVIFTVLGPNGAGKTTLLKILAGILKRDRGHLEVLGLDPRKDKSLSRHMLYIPDNVDRLPSDLTLADFLVYMNILGARIDLREAKSLAESIDLDRFRNTKIAHFSRGTKQKVFVLLAMLTRPQLLLADEPTTGLDPIIRERFLDFLKSLAAEGTTVFFSSHIIQEVESLADYVLVLDEGKKVFEGNAKELLELYESDVYEVLVDDHEKLSEALKKAGFSIELVGERIYVSGDPKRIRREVPQIIASLGLELYRFVPYTGGFREVIGNARGRDIPLLL